MRGKIKLLGLALALLSIGTIIGAVKINATSYVDNSPDCDKYAIVRCGTFSHASMRSNYNKGDHAAVFKSFGISKSQITGMKTGVVYQNGTVKVSGKTVATHAVMSARHLGGSSIAGSSSAKRLSVSHMGSAQSAFVKFDSNGRFMFAIMKPCGNPVVGTPTKPKPKPKPKPAAVCKNLSATTISRTKFRLNAASSVKNGAKVKGYNFTVKDKDGTTVTNKTVTTSSTTTSLDVTQSTPGDYTATVSVSTTAGTKTADACAAGFTVTPPPAVPVYVCDALNVEKISSTKYQFDTDYTLSDATLKDIVYVVTDSNGKELSRSTDTTYTQETPGAYTVQAYVTVTVNGKEKTVTSSDCTASFSVPKEQEYCTVPGKEHLPVDSPKCKEKENCLIPGKEHLPVDSPKCKETVTPTPEVPELPTTGPIGVVSQLIGLGALIASSSYYIRSRQS